MPQAGEVHLIEPAPSSSLSRYGLNTQPRYNGVRRTESIAGASPTRRPAAHCARRLQAVWPTRINGGEFGEPKLRPAVTMAPQPSPSGLAPGP
jgi:hypothetical protein